MPKNFGKKHETDFRDLDSFNLQNEIEKEMEELGVYGNEKPATPTKADIERNRNFTEEERAIIYECLIENNNNIDGAVEDYTELSEKGGRLKPINKRTLQSFRMRNIDDYAKEIAADIGMTAIMKIAKDGKQEQTRSLAGQYLMNRGFGMPTQKTESITTTITWEERLKMREGQREKYQPDGKWTNPTEKITT